MDRNILFSKAPYVAPSWISSAVTQSAIPCTRLNLGRFPTPYHSFAIPGLEGLELDCFIKRDDLSSFDLSGNKVRKLEFLLADCLEKGHDSVVTIGGLQSNHARATAVASSQLGLEPHLILRTNAEPHDIGFEGNLLLDRLVGSHIYTVKPATYATIGSLALTEQLAHKLRESGRNPYVIPVGGSNSLGAFGYIDAVHEMIEQGIVFDHIVFACGSGGTATGIALAIRLAGLKESIVHAVGVCDSPEYFYAHIRDACAELGVDYESVGDPTEWLHIHSGNGIGYARSTSEELEFIANLSRSTGVVLDPVYSGKALYYFVHKVVRENRDMFRPGQKVLFVHTGGVLGMYDKVEQLKATSNQRTIVKLTEFCA